ncbi:hypothetical protein ABZ746_16860 [Streptomyces sp. NPDC020096]
MQGAPRRPSPGPDRRACRDTGTTAVVGAAVADGGDLFISALVYGPDGSVVTRYGKQYLFHSERAVFRPGTTARTLEVGGWRLALGALSEALAISADSLGSAWWWRRRPEPAPWILA